ncbi:MAG TPA: prolyl oligopeptidase family serine peptidase [Parachlamydiaceae bacterium]|nr:prolyl oligopeptidase family serine peptidase [Parachlamydiaceae bacterium]
MQIKIDVIDAPGKNKIYHRGPPLNHGPLPSIFYFSLSGEESLGLEPYNQPAVFLSEQGLRVFSLTLPGHEDAFPHQHAIKEWGKILTTGKNVIDEFIETCIQALDFLISQNYVDENYIGVAGLSRGAYIAAQLAAKDERINVILGFAPLTRLETIKGFIELADPLLLSEHSLEKLIPDLINKKLRFYIGNYDSLVGTQHCFSFIHALTECAYQKNRRFPSVELNIYPSIGHKGHGTPPEIFDSGSLWLSQILSQK